MTKTRAKETVLWLLAACVLSPVASGILLALDKAYRMQRIGRHIANEPFAVGFFVTAELFVVALIVTMPVVLLCSIAPTCWARASNPFVLLSLATAGVLLFATIYSFISGSVELHIAATWAFAFLAWPLILPAIRPVVASPN